MSNNLVKPELGFGEALKLAFSRLWDFEGRSRRSEFWWFIFIFFVIKIIVNHLMQLWSVKADSVAECLLMLIPLAITIRRLHDSNKSGWWVHVSYVLGCLVQLIGVFTPVYDIVLRISNTTNPDKVLKIIQDPLFKGYTALSVIWVIASLIVVVFCFLDSNKTTNKYGDSPKYISGESNVVELS